MIAKPTQGFSSLEMSMVHRVFFILSQSQTHENKEGFSLISTLSRRPQESEYGIRKDKIKENIIENRCFEKSSE